MNRILIRHNEEKDRADVLAVFDSNLPEHFRSYEICEHCNKALLFWGMAACAYHGAGLGKLLLFQRLLDVATRAEPVTVDTQPHVSPFFQHCGFALTSVWPSGYRSGMDHARTPL